MTGRCLVTTSLVHHWCPLLFWSPGLGWGSGLQELRSGDGRKEALTEYAAHFQLMRLTNEHHVCTVSPTFLTSSLCLVLSAGLQMPFGVFGFRWVVGILTWVLILTHQAFYLLSYLPSLSPTLCARNLAFPGSFGRSRIIRVNFSHKDYTLLHVLMWLSKMTWVGPC